MNILKNIYNFFNKKLNKWNSIKDKQPHCYIGVTIKRGDNIPIDAYMCMKNGKYYWVGTCGSLKDCLMPVSITDKWIYS